MLPYFLWLPGVLTSGCACVCVCVCVCCGHGMAPCFQPVDKWDDKAQLPHGIPAIRHHLKTVDDVPLLVSIFTDSTPSNVCDMMRIMQENGDVRVLECLLPETWRCNHGCSAMSRLRVC